MGITRVSFPRELAGKADALVLALGVFDGVHLGHQAVIRELTAMAERLSATPCVLYFEPHPRTVLKAGTAPLQICNADDKELLLQVLGVETFVQFPFTLELAGLSPEAFFRRYLQLPELPIRGYCVGDDWRFGAGNAGDGASLRRLSGVDVKVVPQTMVDGKPVSSTRIREALGDGNVRLAARLLGHPFCLHGEVSHGAGRGSSVLSYPTANVAGGGVQLPAFGVYAARGWFDGGVHDGIVYVGDAPTLRGHDVIVELHLFDFAGDLYGKDLRIEFVEYLRGSEVFADAEALKRQIDKDVKKARGVLNE